MPPKPRPLRKGSTASRPTGKDASSGTVSSSPTSKTKSPPKAASKMPPPPSPVPATILGPEMQALEESLKDAALNTGRIFRFYADARKERIVSNAPYPPRSLTRSLGHSLEKYDQICDTIEAQLLHAISVFERDLKAEQARLDAEASASVATRTRSKRPSLSPTALSRVPLPDGSPPPLGPEQQISSDSPISMFPPSQFPPSGASATSVGPRRPSAILSSLHRPSFPLKLDLSPAALAGNVDSSAMGPPMDVNVDLGLTSLPSPVTLAPKTARALANDPNIPDIFGVTPSQSMSVNPGDTADTGPMSGAVGMKTTSGVQEDVIDLTAPEGSGRPTTTLGDSADKPIELDLEGSYDNMDLFGDVETNHNAANGTNTAAGGSGASAQLDVDMEDLFTPQDSQANTFQLDGAISHNDAAPDPGAILAGLTSGGGAAASDSNELSALLPNGGGDNGADGVVSSDSFVALSAGDDAGAQFDLSGIDLSSFHGLFGEQTGGAGEGAGEEMDLMTLLAMSGGDTAVNPTVPNETQGA